MIPKFKLYPAPRFTNQHFNVFIHKTQKKLIDTHPRKHKCMAFFAWSNENENFNLGELHFCLDMLTYGIITHELYHAVTYWSRVTGSMPEEDWQGDDDSWGKSTNEERCAEVIGSLMAQFVVEAKRTRVKGWRDETIYV